MTEPMSRTKLLARFDVLRILSDHDAESAHSQADKALLEFIADKEITDAFEAIKRWYS